MSGTSKIEIPLDIINDPIIDLYFGSNHKAVQQLILFEESSTDINIETLSDVINKQLDSVLQMFLLFSNLKSTFEQFHEIIQ